jgi:hypothetical protein
MVAETRDDNTEPRCCLDDFRPLLNFYLYTVNPQLGHSYQLYTMNNEL